MRIHIVQFPVLSEGTLNVPRKKKKKIRYNTIDEDNEEQKDRGIRSHQSWQGDDKERHIWQRKQWQHTSRACVVHFDMWRWWPGSKPWPNHVPGQLAFAWPWLSLLLARGSNLGHIEALSSAGTETPLEGSSIWVLDLLCECMHVVM